MNGYTKPCRLTIEAPADMLETVAGFQDESRTRAELWFAVQSADADHPETLQWLACVLERRLDEIGEPA